MAFDTIYNKNGTIRGYAQTDNYERLGVHNLLHVEERKAAGVAAGTFTSGAYRTRQLSDVVLNAISGASLLSYQITLPAGDYFCIAYAPGYKVDGHCARLYDLTAAAVKVLGTMAYASASYGVESNSYLEGKFTLENETTLELQHICYATMADTGLGGGHAAVLAAAVSHCKYSDLKIWKVA